MSKPLSFHDSIIIYTYISGYISDDNVPDDNEAIVIQDDGSHISTIKECKSLSLEDQKALSGQYMLSDNIIHFVQQMLKKVCLNLKFIGVTEEHM